MADVPDVPVTAVGGVCGEGKMDAVCLAVFDFGFTGIHFPLVTSPGSDDFDVGSQSLDTKLKTNLVVTFSGCTVADSDSSFLLCNLNKTACDNRTRMGSSQKVFALIHSACL